MPQLALVMRVSHFIYETMGSHQYDSEIMTLRRIYSWEIEQVLILEILPNKRT